MARFANLRPRTGPRRLELAVIVSTRAEYACALADHAAAAALFRDVIDLLVQVPPGPVRDEATVAALLGLGTCRRLSGGFDGARDCLDAARRLTLASPMGPVVEASVANALGILAKDTARYDDAAGLYARALAVLDPDVPAHLDLLAAIHHNIAGLAHVQGRHLDGEAPARRAIALRARLPHAGATDVAADQAVLGAILAGQGRLDEAEALFGHVRSAWTSRFGPDHYEVAVSLNSIATIQQTRGRLAAAEQSFHRALTIKRRVLGDRHAEVAILLNNLAALHAERGDLDRADSTYAEALEVFRAALGRDHPHTRACEDNRRRTRERPEKPVPT